MALYLNGTKIDDPYYNNTKINNIYYNDTKIFTRTKVAYQFYNDYRWQTEWDNEICYSSYYIRKGYYDLSTGSFTATTDYSTYTGVVSGDWTYDNAVRFQLDSGPNWTVTMNYSGSLSGNVSNSSVSAGYSYSGQWCLDKYSELYITDIDS